MYNSSPHVCPYVFVFRQATMVTGSPMIETASSIPVNSRCRTEGRGSS